MNIEKTKQMIETNKNKTISFRFNGNRNQTEDFEGEITDTYKSIFLIKTNNKTNTRSFTYTDVLIGNLEIKS